MTQGRRPELVLYNTLTRGKAPFVPLDADDVRVYVCGPTVYDYAHVGNARPVIVFDVLFRLLRHLYGAAHVRYVRNITDVDDKINARALKDYPDLPLNTAIARVTERTAAQFHADVAALGCLEPTHEPRATAFVLPRADGKTDMASLIQTLLDRGHAYESEGEILFDVTSMHDYGALSGRSLAEQQAGARVAVEAHKKNAADFVLWKGSQASEPGWDATFRIDGADITIRGRPGWHIECSAMSAALLGEVFDIHGGGLDLIFPHHENEIAQSRCAHGTGEMARVWMHNGFVQVEGQKMSKSLGNFVTLHDLLHTDGFGGRAWPGGVLRLAMLMTHYRQPIDFSVKRLEEAAAILERWTEAWRQVRARYGPEVDEWRPVLREDSPLLDDLNTYPVITELNRLAPAAIEGDIDAAARFATMLELLGFDDLEAMSGAAERRARLSDRQVEAIADAIERRLEHIRARDWAEADRIRDELAADGIHLKDSKDPHTGERITTWEARR